MEFLADGHMVARSCLLRRLKFEYEGFARLFRRGLEPPLLGGVARSDHEHRVPADHADTLDLPLERDHERQLDGSFEFPRARHQRIEWRDLFGHRSRRVVLWR